MLLPYLMLTVFFNLEEVIVSPMIIQIIAKPIVFRNILKTLS